MLVLENGGMDMRTLGEVILHARVHRQLSQRELATLCALDRRTVSAWERDARPIDEKSWRTVATELKLPLSLRDKLAWDRQQGGSSAGLLSPRRLRYVPPSDRKTAIRILAFRRRNRAAFAILWALLKKREDWLTVRRFLLTAWADGFHEVEAWMYLLRAGLGPEWLSPQRCGYRKLPFVDPRDRKVVGDCRIPALVRYHPTRPAVIFPQATLLVTALNEVLRPDGLVGMRAHDKVRWCGFEVERNGLPSESERREREQNLKMPLIYLTPADLRRPDFAEWLFERVYETLWPAGR